MIGLRSTLALIVLGLFTQVVYGSNNRQSDCTDLGGVCLPLAETQGCDPEIPGCGNKEGCCIFQGSLLRQSIDNCSLVPVPIDCDQKYKGKCQTVCSPRRIFTDIMCNKDCKCCGCKIKNNCINNLGFCMIIDSQRCEGTTKNKWCKGRKCTCCVPDCPETEKCTADDGHCAKSCTDDEVRHPDIRCITKNNDNCLCCIKKCRTNNICASVDGRCDRACRISEEGSLTHKCDGIGCKCCVPRKVRCPQTVECNILRRVCHDECGSNVREGADTKIELKKELCNEGCDCCEQTPCHNSVDCRGRGGNCRETCLTALGEFSTLIPCRTDKCVCCVLRPQTATPATADPM